MQEHEWERFRGTNRAVTEPSWLPTANEVPELADLRKRHEAVLASHAKALGQLSALQSQRAEDEEKRRAYIEAEALGRKPKGDLPGFRATDDALLDAGERVAACRSAIRSFAREAMVAIREAEPGLLGGLDAVVASADAKEAEARALMEEAARMKARTVKLRTWLARTVGEDPLGLIGWSVLPVPVPVPVPTLEELAEAAVPSGGDVIPLEQSPPLMSSAFGTDDTENLDPDSQPWEAPILS